MIDGRGEEGSDEGTAGVTSGGWAGGEAVEAGWERLVGALRAQGEL